MAPCCCWVLHRWWLGQPRAYWCFLCMVDIKRQQPKNCTPRRRLTTQRQHTNYHLLHQGALKYYTTKASEYYTKIILPQASTPKYYSTPSHITKAPVEYYTESSKFYITKAPRYNLWRNTTIYAFLAHHTNAPNYFSAHSYTTEATA